MVVVAAIGAMAIANSMMKSVSERTREIATLRSIGFHKRDIISLFAFEGLFTCLLACLAGMGLTLIVGGAVGALGITFDAGFLSLPIPLAVAESPGTWLLSASLLSLLAMGTSYVCVRRASAMRIADALRYV
jgi:putative ABC transport system permease protein